MLISSGTVSTLAMSPLRPSQAASAPTSGVSIEIKPGEDNVDSGNRSQNTAEISVTTANREASTVITREQAVDSVERRIQKNTLSQFTNTRAGPSPLQLAALQNSNIDSGDISEIAVLRNQQRLAQTYQNASPSNNSQAGLNTGNTSTDNNGASLYNQAVDAYIKQTLFFSAVDKVTSTISTKA